ncbi:Hypothetical protein A7982_07046 [Minicystis rosea]|nr:Hypothetical protein A7982_07046 [Minicystis rosea]
MLPLRSSILAALGLVACGGSVTVPEGSGGSSTSGTGGATQVCAGATQVPSKDGSVSGFARCPDGTAHKSGPSMCNPNTGVVGCLGTESQLNCTSDADCGGAPHSRCASTTLEDFGGTTTACMCISSCANDAECGAGKVCICAGVAGNDTSFCTTAQCTSGKGCASGECGLSVYENGCGTDVELACRKPDDACRTDGDCADVPGHKCVLDGSTAPWACLGTTCAIGRPLLVDGAARTAAPAARGDWSASGMAPDLTGLDAEARAAIAAHWLDVAALEHASVASFARFTLELLSLGAPAHLVADAQRAGLDEVEHARIAYAMASAYGGHDRGPGALDLRAMTVNLDRRAVVAALITEACVGETLGVAEARAIAAEVRDPAIERIHTRIAADEQRHAELAWRTLAWLLDGADDPMIRFAERCFAEAIASMSSDPSPSRTLPEHGLLGAAALGKIRRLALVEVVRPCASALLERARRASNDVAVAHV